MISLRGVAVHNLKQIDLDLPLGKLIVFCGRSGSGKSSLVLDTIYAEGQRRYIETFSPAVRRYLEKIEKPAAERLEGIPPAVAVTAAAGKSESTVGDQTELTDYLALLFARSGHVFCPKCSRPVTADSPQTVSETLKQIIETKTKIQIAFSPPPEENAAEFAVVWKEQGFLRGLSNGVPFRLDEPLPPHFDQDNLLLIADRLTRESAEEERIIESLETAMKYGGGKCTVLTDQTAYLFSQSLSCEYCDIYVPPLTAKIFDTDWKKTIHLSPDPHSPVLDDLLNKTAAELILFFDAFFDTINSTGSFPADEIRSRLRFLQDAGLEHLTLNRPLSTLSSGEQRRVALASVLGSCLAEMLYVLDEPTLGLHPSAAEKVLKSILQLRDRGNTVIAVEHNEQILRSADYIVEFGPGAGDDGGQIVFQGTVEELLNDTKSLTAKYLRNE